MTSCEVSTTACKRCLNQWSPRQERQLGIENRYAVTLHWVCHAALHIRSVFDTVSAWRCHFPLPLPLFFGDCFSARASFFMYFSPIKVQYERSRRLWSSIESFPARNLRVPSLRRTISDRTNEVKVACEASSENADASSCKGKSPSLMACASHAPLNRRMNSVSMMPPALSPFQLTYV